MPRTPFHTEEKVATLVTERKPLEKKRCGQCGYFTYLNPHICETLNLSQNPFSLWFRLRFGHGVCLAKKKMVRHGKRACNDYEEK